MGATAHPYEVRIDPMVMRASDSPFGSTRFHAVSGFDVETKSGSHVRNLRRLHWWALWDVVFTLSFVFLTTLANGA